MTTDWPTLRTAPGARAPLTGWDRAMQRDSVLWRLDWLLLAAVAALAGLGTVLVWAATKPQFGGNGYLYKDLLNIVIGVGLGLATMLVNYRVLRAYAPVLYGVSCVGLIAVLSPLGSTINGAKSWIELGGGFSVQPSEFAKVALVVGLAMFLGEKREGTDAPKSSDVMVVLGLAAVPLGLILKQPDLGSVLVFVFMIFVVLAVSGVRTRWLVGLVLAGAALVAIAVHSGALSTYQVDRFKAFTDPTADTQGYAYNVYHARIAIGSGGVFGTGLFHGPQTNGHFVPEQQTDFVFTVAGEELGLVGAGGIILLFGLVLWRGLRIASRANDLFGTLVAVGVVAWFAFQGFENIGMTIGLMPVTGLPLPFVSYGGSSMFANMMAVGLLQNVRLHDQDG